MKVPPRIFKITGILLIIAAILITTTALILPYLLDINSYRSEIVAALQQSFKRQVNFSSGTFSWHFGPSFQFKSFTVKERDDSSDFISSKHVTVRLALLPLLQKKVEIKKLILDEAVISLFRTKEGILNIDDLMKSDKEDGVHVNFAHIRMNRGTIRWKDLAVTNEPLSAELHNISIIANNISRGEKGNIKFAGDIPATVGDSSHIAFSGNFRLPPDGESMLETVADGDFSLRQAEIGRFWPYFGRFIPFGNTGGRVDISTNFKGKLKDFQAKGKVLVNGATFNWPTIFHKPLTPKNLQLEYRIALNQQLIDISTVDLGMDGFRIKGSFQLHDYLSADPRIIAKASTPSTFRYEDVRYYVPYGIIESSTSDYIENKIKSGIFKLDTGILDGRISQITHMEVGQNCNTLFIRGPVKKAVLSYGSKAPTFNELSGIIELKGKNFNLVGMTGNFGTSPFSLEGSITEYNTKEPSDFPVKMDIAPNAPEMAWLAKIAGIPKLEFGNSSNNPSLHLVGSGHYSAYRFDGNYDLKQVSYLLPGYINKPLLMPNTLKFSTIIGKDATQVTSVLYDLQPLVLNGKGKIGYGDSPYLGFDLQTNRFEIGENLPIISKLQKYKVRGSIQAHIKGGGDPADMSVLDYSGTVVDLFKLSFQPEGEIKQIRDLSGSIILKGNSLETTRMIARYGNSAINTKATIKSFKSPEYEISLSTPQMFFKDLNMTEGRPDASIRNLTAEFTLRKDFISLKKVSGLINSSDFSLNGVYVPGSTPQASLNVTSTKLDIDDLRPFTSAANKPDRRSNPQTDVILSLNAEACHVGKLLFNKLTVAIQREKGITNIQNLNAGLFGGKLSAKGKIASAGELGNSYEMAMELSKADAEKLFSIFGSSRSITGNMTLSGTITAQGNSFLDIRKSAVGNFRINATNGTLKKFSTLSKLFSILNVSQLLKFKLPDMVSGGMPYSSIKGNITVKDGNLSSQDLFISSNAINISIIGSADIVKEELNLTLGVQPLQTVDKIVNRIPIVGWLLTGKDKDLLTAYFEAKGKWSNPQVSAIPVKSIGKGMLNMFIRVFELPVKLFTDTGEVILGQ